MLELAGVELNEAQYLSTALRKEALDILDRIRDFHYNLGQMKKSEDHYMLPTALEPALYQIASELEKFDLDN